jgi:hypothetical protein
MKAQSSIFMQKFTSPLRLCQAIFWMLFRIYIVAASWAWRWRLLGRVIKETSFCLAEKDRLFLPGKASFLQLLGLFQVLLMLLKMRLFFLIDRYQDW